MNFFRSMCPLSVACRHSCSVSVHTSFSEFNHPPFLIAITLDKVIAFRIAIDLLIDQHMARSGRAAVFSVNLIRRTAP